MSPGMTFHQISTMYKFGEKNNIFYEVYVFDNDFGTWHWIPLTAEIVDRVYYGKQICISNFRTSRAKFSFERPLPAPKTIVEAKSTGGRYKHTKPICLHKHTIYNTGSDQETEMKAKRVKKARQTIDEYEYDKCVRELKAARYEYDENDIAIGIDDDPYETEIMIEEFAPNKFRVKKTLQKRKGP